MKGSRLFRRLTSFQVLTFGIGPFVLCLALSLNASSIQLVSNADPKIGPASGGGGDSYLSTISRDGRFVLFSSIADNLVQIATNRPLPELFPQPLNVFLRDRSNNTTVLISVAFDGTAGGNADSAPIGVSTNGRYALFESSASNLVPGDTNDVSDVFVRDLVSGTTTLVSVSTNGSFPDDTSYSSVMTPDGRYVAFTSDADNLVPGDTNGIPDVFVRDLVNHTTTLISVGAQNWDSLLLDVISDAAVITPDGRYVAFYSTAQGLLPGVQTLGNVYVRDLVARTTTWASVAALPMLQLTSVTSNAFSFNHQLSDDGRYVAFEAVDSSIPTFGVILRYDMQSAHTDLIETNAAAQQTIDYETIQDLWQTPDGRFVAYVANELDTSGATTSIHVWDAQSGLSTLASPDLTGPIPYGSICDSPVLDDSGRFVAFLSTGATLVTNALVGDFHIYQRDLQKGLTTLVDADTNGVGSMVDSVTGPIMSSDGRFIAFDSQDSSLVPLDRNRSYDVFVRDTMATTTELSSVHDPAFPSLSPDGPSAISTASVSSDARLIAFWSEGDDLVMNDTNGLRDVYIRDLVMGTNLLLSVATNGFSGDGFSGDPAISADGRYAAFSSYADNLVSGDTNNSEDVFIVDLTQGTPRLVSVNSSGTGPGNADSFLPILSSDGRFVIFHSMATNLAPGMTGSLENLFLRDLQSQSTFALTTNGVTAAAMTPDGGLVAYITSSSRVLPGSDRLNVWNVQIASVALSLSGQGFSSVAISSNALRVAYTTNNAAGLTQLLAVDLVSGTNWAIASYLSSSTTAPSFSSDGRFLVYIGGVGASPATNQIYLYDFQTKSNLLVSQSYDGSGPGDGDSDSPDISSDGRFVCYRSSADNLVPGDANGVPDIFMYDHMSAITTLVTASRFGIASADNRSLTPVFSGDAKNLVFVSWASDLVPSDFNNNADVFALSLNNGSPIPVFELQASFLSGPTPGTLLSWPVVFGVSYSVQFKSNLSDPVWQDTTAPVSVLGGQAYFKDSVAGVAHRFYRVLAF